jgi:hypothetical protein
LGRKVDYTKAESSTLLQFAFRGLLMAAPGTSPPHAAVRPQPVEADISQNEKGLTQSRAGAQQSFEFTLPLLQPSVTIIDVIQCK